MIIANDQAQYNAYWAAYRQIWGSGLRINVDPHVGPLLALARATYNQLVIAPNVGFSFAGHGHIWLNVAQHVAYRASLELANPTGNVDVAVLTAGVHNLGVALGVDLIGDPQVVAQPGGIEGMDVYMNVDDQ
jgi:hypothetical protein